MGNDADDFNSLFIIVTNVQGIGIDNHKLNRILGSAHSQKKSSI